MYLLRDAAAVMIYMILVAPSQSTATQRLAHAGN